MTSIEPAKNSVPIYVDITDAGLTNCICAFGTSRCRFACGCVCARWVTGSLRKSGDVEGVKTAVISLLQNPSQRQQFSTAARAHYQNYFNWSLLAAQLEMTYQIVA